MVIQVLTLCLHGLGSRDLLKYPHTCACTQHPFCSCLLTCLPPYIDYNLLHLIHLCISQGQDKVQHRESTQQMVACFGKHFKTKKMNGRTAPRTLGTHSSRVFLDSHLCLVKLKVIQGLCSLNVSQQTFPLWLWKPPYLFSSVVLFCFFTL